MYLYMHTHTCTPPVAEEPFSPRPARDDCTTTSIPQCIMNSQLRACVTYTYHTYVYVMTCVCVRV